jgi:hypothetical protein
MILDLDLTAEQAAMIIYGLDNFSMCSIDQYSFDDLESFSSSLQKMYDAHHPMNDGVLASGLDDLLTEEQLVEEKKNRKELNQLRSQEIKEAYKLLGKSESQKGVGDTNNLVT